MVVAFTSLLLRNSKLFKYKFRKIYEWSLALGHGGYSF